METCAFCKKQMLIKLIVAVMDLKTTDIANDLHISQSLISRHLTGEKNRPEIDIYIVEKLLGIKIKDYTVIND